jgi:hypothetical protein
VETLVTTVRVLLLLLLEVEAEAGVIAVAFVVPAGVEVVSGARLFVVGGGRITVDFFVSSGFNGQLGIVSMEAIRQLTAEELICL